jgi:hypothetical protein
MAKFILPGSKVRHKDIKLNGTVISCINLYELEDRLNQGPRYYVATSVDVWSITQDSLVVLEEGQGLSDYYKNRYAKYLITGFEIAEFDPKTNPKLTPATLDTPQTKIQAQE